MRNVEHIGIAVKDFSEANALYFKLLGVEPYKTEFVPAENVNTSFFKVGGTKIELLEGTTEDSAITKFVQKRGEGIHHIAFEVEDIGKEMERLRQEGFTLLSETPRKGADNKLVCFVHPKSAGGVLIELTQEIS
ncbi:methylmalonyl-CoA epimerase [Pontibacter saemangeumensis]|uniref:Methylmalonyl-CoA epimerase n=1 Tax=Pontibacter saemangeumensis TaxID=1084525 RepID=A0ABP8LGV1_9BACT